MPGEISWYVVRGEEQTGPFTDPQLRAYAEKGDLKPDDQVWRPGFDSWRRAGDVPGLLRPPTIAKRDTPPTSPAAQQQSSSPPPSPLEGASPVEPIKAAATQPDRKLIGVRGWLLLLCIQLTILGPLVAMGQIAGLFQQLRPSFPTVAGLESFFVFVMVVALVFLLASISVGVMLWSRRQGAPNFVRWFLLSAFAWACLSPYTTYLFVRMPPGAVPGILAAALPELLVASIVTFTWYSYLLKSKRVLANFGPTASPARAGTSSQPAVPTHLPRPKEGETRKGQVISVPKTAGILIAISALCVIFLALTTGQFDDGPAYTSPSPGYENSVAAKSGRAVGHAFVIFVLGAIGAAIARLVTLKARGDGRYLAPALGGVIVALVVTALIWIGASTRGTATAPPEKQPATWAPGPALAEVEAILRRWREGITTFEPAPKAKVPPDSPNERVTDSVIAGWEELRRKRRLREGVPTPEQEPPENEKSQVVQAQLEKDKKWKSWDGFQKHVDRKNGFSVYYDAKWTRSQPNEEVTKLLVVSPEGNRCWVIAVPNPLIQAEAHAKQVVQWLIKNPKAVEAQLRQVHGNANVASVRPVVMAGKHHAALFSYSVRHKAFDTSAFFAILEAHILVKNFTYKVGCSTAGPVLTSEFKDGTAPFFRSFLFIPRDGS